MVKDCSGGQEESVNRRTVFFVSDQTGVTAETMGHSLLTQFENEEFRQVTLPFVSSVDKAQEAVRRIDQAAAESGLKPIIFGTLVQEDIREIVKRSKALFLDFFEPFVGAIERELQVRSTHRPGRAHGVPDSSAYTARMDATNYAMANDDGSLRDYARADVILVGVSRSGKTPTCLYMALHYGVFAANYPLTDDDLEHASLPRILQPYRSRLYGLTIRPERLQQIRQERRPDSRYASLQQVQYELRGAEAMFRKHSVPYVNTTDCSVEEIASRIMQATGIERRVHS
jgi:hypothetical protein